MLLSAPEMQMSTHTLDVSKGRHAALFLCRRGLQCKPHVHGCDAANCLEVLFVHFLIKLVSWNCVPSEGSARQFG